MENDVLRRFMGPSWRLRPDDCSHFAGFGPRCYACGIVPEEAVSNRSSAIGDQPHNEIDKVPSARNAGHIDEG